MSPIVIGPPPEHDAMAYKISNENKYDIVIMHTLISHVTEPKIVLTNAMKYIKKSGKIIIFDADYETLLMSSGDKKLDNIFSFLELSEDPQK